MSDIFSDQMIDDAQQPSNISRMNSSSNMSMIQKIKKLEISVKLLNEKVKILSEENKDLRDMNIQNQLENFKLKRKIKDLESATSDVYEDQTYEIMNDNYESVEYIDEGNLTFEDVEDKFPSSPVKRSYSEAFDESEMIEHDINDPQKEEPKEEYLVDDETIPEDDGDYYLKDDLQVKEEKSSMTRFIEYQIPFVEPKDAYIKIRDLATKKGALDKLTQIPKGRQGDSTFINKCLELLYDRLTLAASSTRGQKFQGKFDVAPKPALDPKKLNLCRQAFLYRMLSEGLSIRDDRFKLFHGHVNSKIQNTRKCVKKQKTPIRGFTH